MHTKNSINFVFLNFLKLTKMLLLITLYGSEVLVHKGDQNIKILGKT